MVKIVVYDLASENYKAFQGLPGLRREIRNVRVWCTERLHALGVQCTESVILVSPFREGMIEPAIRAIEDKYNALRGRLRDNGLALLLQPVIRVLPLTPMQYNTFRELAQRRIVEIVDSAIERISNLIDAISEITEEAKRRQTVYGLNRLERELSDLASRARDLEIPISTDYNYLIELIDEARRRLA